MQFAETRQDRYREGNDAGGTDRQESQMTRPGGHDRLEQPVVEGEQRGEQKDWQYQGYCDQACGIDATTAPASEPHALDYPVDRCSGVGGMTSTRSGSWRPAAVGQSLAIAIGISRAVVSRWRLSAGVKLS